MGGASTNADKERERQRLREQERRKREAVRDLHFLCNEWNNSNFFFFFPQLAGQIDMNRQSDLMAAFEELL